MYTARSSSSDHGDHGDHHGEGQSSVTRRLSYISRARRQTRRFFSSRAKHWVILTLILLDVAGILADIFIALITCELHRQDEDWVALTTQALTTFALTMSCLFMVELGLSVFAGGLK